MIENAVKKPFFGLIWVFLHVAPRKMTALTRDFRWTYWSKCIVYIPNIKSVRHLEVCQYAAKCSENAFFFTFLEFFKRGSRNNDSIDAKF